MSISARTQTALGLARSLVIYYGLPWRRRALKRFYAGLIRPGDLVFDIGAHVGSRSQTLAALGARVVAVEPQPAFADFIARRLASRLHGFERVAVGRREGTIDLLISSLHPTVTSVSRHFVETVSQTQGFASVVWDRRLRVPMVTLEGLINRYGLPVFCKIDVEGAEADILAGLERPIGLIAFEYTPAMPAVAAAAVDRLGELGSYRYNRVVGESHRFTSGHWLSAGELLAELAALPADANSGDVYARIEQP